jgi:hypothetical protein
MTQTRKQSAFEAAANIAVGFVIALASQLVIFPMYGVHVPLSTDIAITGWFTVISLVRSYALRRAFNSIK